MGFTSIASFLCCRVFKVVKVSEKKLGLEFFLTKLMPVGLCQALTNFFGNTSYLYLTVAFIQMLKALSPVITMLGLFLVGLEKPTRRLIASVLLIAGGVALASAGEVNMNYLGFTFQMLAEATEAARLVMTQLLLVGLEFHPVEGLMYLAPACTLWLAVGSILLEVPKMQAVGALSVVLGSPGKFVLAACMGFVVNGLVYIIIKTASSLTLKVVGTAKSGLVVVLGMVFLQEVVTLIQGVGYGIAIAAFFWYNHIKMKQMGTADKLAGKATTRSESAEGDLSEENQPLKTTELSGSNSGDTVIPMRKE
ncbi:hypothetical protein N2152v2_010437 [Parachlorella kessleri]